MSLEIKL